MLQSECHFPILFSLVHFAAARFFHHIWNRMNASPYFSILFDLLQQMSPTQGIVRPSYSETTFYLQYQFTLSLAWGLLLVLILDYCPPHQFLCRLPSNLAMFLRLYSPITLSTLVLACPHSPRDLIAPIPEVCSKSSAKFDLQHILVWWTNHELSVQKLNPRCSLTGEYLFLILTIISFIF